MEAYAHDKERAMAIGPQDMLMLENLVDGSSLHDVLSALANICGEKSVHIAENWQDVALAKRWNQRAMAIDLMLADKYNLFTFDKR